LMEGSFKAYMPYAHTAYASTFQKLPVYIALV
jgi:hypothetical protein